MFLKIYPVSTVFTRGNYYFLNLEIQRSQYINVWKLFKGGICMRKYGIQSFWGTKNMCTRYAG